MALEKITQITGHGVYVSGDDVDTDRIIPARFLKCITFDDLSGGLFADVRFDKEGNKQEHPLNDSRFAEASIMLVNRNFGSGSSREHAPQSIYRAGFRAIIGESFAEIFFGNATTLGMPCVEATREQIEEMAVIIETNPKTKIIVDVENKTVTLGDKTCQVSIKDTAHNALISGRWDPLQELLESDKAISETVAKLPYLSHYY